MLNTDNRLAPPKFQHHFMTKHARDRIQQRGISSLVVDWLYSYGARQYVKRNLIVIYFDRKARKKLKRAVGSRIADLVSSQLNAYIVVDQETEDLITVGHRYKRIRST